MSIEKLNGSTFVNELEDGFCSISNLITQKLKLSDKALGVYCYLASKPRGWKIRLVDVCNRFGVGRDRVKASFKELREAGLLTTKILRNELGHIIGKDLILHAAPVDNNKKNPETNKTENPSHGERDTALEPQGLHHKPENPSGEKHVDIYNKDLLQNKDSFKNQRNLETKNNVDNLSGVAESILNSHPPKQPKVKSEKLSYEQEEAVRRLIRFGVDASTATAWARRYELYQLNNALQAAAVNGPDNPPAYINKCLRHGGQWQLGS